GHGHEPRHAIGEGADTGQDNTVRGADAIGVGGDHDLRSALRSRARKRLFGGAQIARAVIDNGDGLAHKTPLVEGIWSATRGSISTAFRSARATALKQLSAMW